LTLWARTDVIFVSIHHTPLARRPVLRRLLSALVEHHGSHPGQPLRSEEIVQRVWPTIEAEPQTRNARLRRAIASLRALHLGGNIVTEAGGYRLRGQVMRSS
jgi:DNA-binding winged helix-turn-helix (wHTH) protein